MRPPAAPVDAERALRIDSVELAFLADGLCDVREDRVLPELRADCMLALEPRGEAGGVGRCVPPGVRGVPPPVMPVSPPAWACGQNCFQ